MKTPYGVPKTPQNHGSHAFQDGITQVSGGVEVDEPVSFPTQGSLTPPAQVQPPMAYQTGVLDDKGYEWL